MGTKANPGKYDCYEKADPDEPLFVLRAKDPNAACLVWLWATMAEMQSEQEPEKVADARACVAQMINWAHEKGIKAHGLGVATLSAVMEMTRAANTAVKKLHAEATRNEPTTVDDFRLFFAQAMAAEE